jgi:hypothetical protein
MSIQIANLGGLESILDTDILAGLWDGVAKRNSKQDRYLQLMRGINILSYSTFGALHTCERQFQKNKLRLAANKNTPRVVFAETNIDFAFGRAVESGIHSTLLKKSKPEIFFDMFMAWDIPLFQEHPRNYAKTFVDSLLAIDQFGVVQSMLFEGWEIAYFDGKPAIEVSMCIDLGNGYYYVGHADVILWHPIEQRFRVLEIKTTGAKYVHEAMYQNSDQAVGYSIMLDSIAKDLENSATFEVFYLVFGTSMDKWMPFHFTKSRSQRAGWINTLLLDIQRINTYRQVSFWPKRGGSCMKYGKPCSYFGICDLGQEEEFEVISEEEIAKHEFDFRFKLDEIIQTQTELI